MSKGETSIDPDDLERYKPPYGAEYATLREYVPLPTSSEDWKVLVLFHDQSFHPPRAPSVYRYEVEEVILVILPQKKKLRNSKVNTPKPIIRRPATNIDDKENSLEHHHTTTTNFTFWICVWMRIWHHFFRNSFTLLPNDGCLSKIDLSNGSIFPKSIFSSTSPVPLHSSQSPSSSPLPLQSPHSSLPVALQ